MVTIVHCRRCDARFDPSVKFILGYAIKGDTSGEFVVTSSVKPGDCPICNKRPGTGPREGD
jgi:hypothetical protein